MLIKIDDGFGAGSSACFISTSTTDSPANGSSPVSISNAMMPTAYRSIAGVTAAARLLGRHVRRSPHQHRRPRLRRGPQHAQLRDAKVEQLHVAHAVALLAQEDVRR